jgi:hypothetical protein
MTGVGNRNRTDNHGRSAPTTGTRGGRAVAALLVAAALGVSGVASATVRHDGKWPEADKDKTVSLDVAGVSRQEAIRKLADAAGWSVVMPNGPMGNPEPVDIHVKGQSPSKVLDLILSDGTFVATRDGTMINIAKDGAARESESEEGDEHGAAGFPAGSMPAMPPVPPVPPMPPMPPVPGIAPLASASMLHGLHGKKHGRHGEDRVVTGGHVTIEKSDVVGDVTVLGGSLDVEGEVQGDLAVFGGNVRIHDGAQVHGDAAVVGGALNVDDGATVDGDVSVVGGSLKRGDNAHIGGEARDDKGKINVNVNVDDNDEDTAEDAHQAKASWFSHVMSETGSAITRSAFLFIFGAIFLALGTARMETLKTEIAARPMKNFALGVMGGVASVVGFVLLCVTIIGIPVALVSLLVGAVAVYAGVTAVLTTAGQAVMGHKTKNPYVHLAVGCAMLLVLGALPYIGIFVRAAVMFIGIGVLVATRCAGLIPSRHVPRQTPVDPYRTAADL